MSGQNLFARIIIDAENRSQAALNSVRSGFSSIGDSISSAKNMLLGFFAIGGIKQTAEEVIGLADRYTNLSSKLRLVTTSEEEYAAAQAELFAIAQRTRTDLESVGVLYTRNINAIKAMGGTSADAMAVTETLAKAFKVSGASAGESASVVLQLSQALGSGVLRGEEFNAIMENGPRVAKALADGLNVPIGALRKMATEGQLTSTVVLQALQGQKEAIATEYAKLDVTVSDTFTKIKNRIFTYIGETNAASGATKDLNDAINSATSNENVATAMTSAKFLFNIMASGINTIEAGFFALAGAIANVISGFVSGAAAIQEGLAKITFGEVSKGFAAAAAESRLIAESFAASAQVNIGKAGKAFDDAAASGEKAQAGFGVLIDKGVTVVAAMTQVTEATGLTADQLDALGEGAQVAGGKVVALADAAIKAGASMQDSVGSALALEAAYKDLGVKSSAELQKTADAAQKSFAMIKDSGVATAADIANAFQSYAERAAAANNGVISATIQASAAANNLGVTTGLTGKIIVTSYTAGAQSAEQLASSTQQAANAAKNLKEANKQEPSQKQQNLQNSMNAEQQAAQQQADSFAAADADFKARIKNGAKASDDAAAAAAIASANAQQDAATAQAKQAALQNVTDQRNNDHALEYQKFLAAQLELKTRLAAASVNAETAQGKSAANTPESRAKALAESKFSVIGGAQKSTAPTHIIQIRSPDGSRVANVNAGVNDAKNLLAILGQFKQSS